jgi:hypothetical protein
MDKNPRAQAIGFAMYQQWLQQQQPDTQIVQQPDGTIVAIDKRRQVAKPIYQGAARPELDVREVNGRVIATDKRTGQARDITPEGMPQGFRQLATPEERAKYGIGPDDRKPYQIGPDGKLHSAGGVAVTNDMRGESEEQKKLGQGAGERANKTMDAMQAAPGKLAQFAELEALLGRVKTGRIEPGRMNLSAWGKSLGVNDEWLTRVGLDPNGVGDAQALEKMVGRMMVDLIGKGGFPANNFSDADRKFLLGVFPQLADDPRANRLVVEVGRRAAQRDIEKGRAWNAHRRDPANKGRSYDEFEADWAEQIERKDVLGDLRKEAEALLTGVPGNPGGPAAPAGQSAPSGRTSTGIPWKVQ